MIASNTKLKFLTIFTKVLLRFFSIEVLAITQSYPYCFGYGEELPHARCDADLFYIPGLCRDIAAGQEFGPFELRWSNDVTLFFLDFQSPLVLLMETISTSDATFGYRDCLKNNKFSFSFVRKQIIIGRAVTCHGQIDIVSKRIIAANIRGNY